ncbi:cytochrome c oxidase subunit 4 [Mycetocola tolaasinivorans]|uniref:Cytochrome c oxidase polypeptide 4 n=1 Tax=Mycetocola tolaasinivorans TaxID=76635 RepID=A0A3L7ADK8_9MICO|nr:cytochrome c oxidase subunit 4 [Mycetocola tolaasinivorans]RLP78085.1 cytochrome c oxidase subunit 4 [Mycetocola tolaasinivorans]
MKSNISILWILAVFCLVLSGVYTFWNIVDEAHGRVEWVGTVALVLSAILSGFIAFYLRLVYRKQGGELPEDNVAANIDDADPELGHFSPWSWWPFALVGGASVVIIGLAVGQEGNFWLSWFGVPLVVVSLVGWVYEYYRGRFAH